MEISYDSSILERFIPVAYDELFERCLETGSFQEKQEYRKFSSLLRTFYHLRFHKELLELKRLYSPFSPDADTLTLQTFTHGEYETLKSDMVSKIRPLLNSANYEELTQESLSEAMNRTSPYGVEVSVDFDDFEDILLFFRGTAHRFDKRRTLSTLYLKKEEVRIDVYRRLFILLKPKSLDQRAREISQKEGEAFEKVKKRLKKESIVLTNSSKGECIYLKLFKDIPHADLEMLFPNTKVKMSLHDKLKIGITGGGGTIGGTATLIGKLGAAVEPFSLIMAVGAFGGVLWRQIKTVFTHRTRYMATLAKNLYFYNLDNNAGVLSYMIDTAEAEECKEALLAYLFVSGSERPLDRKELDSLIEAYMLETYDIPMDFEVDDGGRKLLQLGLIDESDGVIRAVGVKEALDRLDGELKKLSVV